MIAKRARDVARQWVHENATDTPGFRGALYHGSIVSIPDSAVMQPTSDVDIVIVTDAPELPKLGKFMYQGVLLDVSYLPWAECQSPEKVLGTSHLAASFRNPDIVSDPTGELTRLQLIIAQEFAKRSWVVRRCQHALKKIEATVDSIDKFAWFPEQVTAWLFATGVTTHVLLVAGLRNPTVRKRYVAVRDLLSDYGHPAFHKTLLTFLGCADMSRARAEHHLAALAETFDATVPLVRTPFFFASDISALARPIAIDGSRELIDRGDHRESIFWIVATYSRCMTVLQHDAPDEIRSRYEHGFRELLSDLGVESVADLTPRGQEVHAFLPQLWEMAERIIVANPDIQSTAQFCRRR